RQSQGFGAQFRELRPSPSTLGRKEDGPMEGTAPQNATICRLSPRQTEVLLMICDGFVSKEIAQMLGISPKTVEFHKANLFEKTGMRSTALLVRYAIRNGLIV